MLKQVNRTYKLAPHLIRSITQLRIFCRYVRDQNRKLPEMSKVKDPSAAEKSWLKKAPTSSLTERGPSKTQLSSEKLDHITETCISTYFLTSPMLKEILAATLDSVEQLQHIFFQLSSGLGILNPPGMK